MSRTYDELRSATASARATATTSAPAPVPARRARRAPDSPSDALNLRPLYFSTRRLARVLGVLFVIGASLGWVAAGYDLGELRTLHSGAALDPSALLAHHRAGERIAAAQIAFALLVAAVFVPWLYQARANVRALGARRLRFGREWTYLAFAVPILNAYRPYQVMSEVWRGSDPTSIDPLGWHRLSTARLVLGWWVGLAGWVGLALLAELLIRVAPGVVHVQIAHALALAGDAGAAVSASLGYFLVSRISAAQDAKWARLGGTEGAPDLGAACGSAVSA
jgi:hypothetical protein